MYMLLIHSVLAKYPIRFAIYLTDLKIGSKALRTIELAKGRLGLALKHLLNNGPGNASSPENNRSDVPKLRQRWPV